MSFVIGCSFTFEHALMAEGIALRHVEQGRNVAMYRTSMATEPAGAFHGPMVVSMRPLRAADAIRAVQITSRFPAVHGAPVHIGDPVLIGIRSIADPDYGDAVEVMPDEIPVFWACGVTPQAALAAARLPFAITHAPGSMLVTDLLHHQLAAF
ncbi:putative hydro-lyase [compost metagenome]